MAEGKVRIFMGEGKAKTPAATGLALRCASEGGKAVIIQFFKGRGLPESDYNRKLEPGIKIFRFEKSDIAWKDMNEEQHAKEAVNIRNGLHYARKVLLTGECNVLVLDDVLGLVDNGIVTADEMGEVLKYRGDTDVILTGTRMDQGLCRYADDIVEMVPVSTKKS